MSRKDIKKILQLHLNKLRNLSSEDELEDMINDIKSLEIKDLDIPDISEIKKLIDIIIHEVEMKKKSILEDIKTAENVKKGGGEYIKNSI